MDAPNKSKKVGGFDRAALAREELKLIFVDENNPFYFDKDIQYAHKFDVSRHTIYKIRDEMKIPPRSERILNKLRTMDTANMSLNRISETLKIKYQNLYKIVMDAQIPFK